MGGAGAVEDEDMEDPDNLVCRDNCQWHVYCANMICGQCGAVQVECVRTN